MGLRFKNILPIGFLLKRYNLKGKCDSAFFL
jgi:hypothetical protein